MKALADARRRRYARHLVGRGLEIGALGNPSLPDKRYTFDHRRARTPLAYLEEDHGSTVDPQVRNDCHLLDWAEHVEVLRPHSTAFAERVAEQRRRGFGVHNHDSVLQDVLELIAHVRDAHGVPFRLVRWSNTSPFGNEFNLLLRKAEGGGAWLALARRAAIAAHPLHELLSRARRRVRPAASGGRSASPGSAAGSSR